MAAYLLLILLVVALPIALGLHALRHTGDTRDRPLCKEEELARYGMVWDTDLAYQQLLADQLAAARRRRWAAHWTALWDGATA